MPGPSDPTGSPYRVLRVGPGDRELAKRMFAVLAGVFEEEHAELSDAYVDQLLAREDFWAIAALSGDDVVGGLTAHTLLMTRAEAREIFIYDIAVQPEHQRKGIGRQLLQYLRQAAGEIGIQDLFVPADDEDVDAIEFYRTAGGTPAPVTIFTFTRE